MSSSPEPGSKFWNTARQDALNALDFEPSRRFSDWRRLIPSARTSFTVALAAGVVGATTFIANMINAEPTSPRQYMPDKLAELILDDGNGEALTALGLCASVLNAESRLTYRRSELAGRDTRTGADLLYRSRKLEYAAHIATKENVACLNSPTANTNLIHGNFQATVPGTGGKQTVTIIVSDVTRFSGGVDACAQVRDFEADQARAANPGDPQLALAIQLQRELARGADCPMP
jgi:hypothetical protein